jgi:hypothetical protein
MTTMIDYHGLPADVPGMATRPNGTPFDRVAFVETAIVRVIDDRRFVPHLILHELEGPLAIADLGLDELRKVCPHADGWLRRLESLA